MLIQVLLLCNNPWKICGHMCNFSLTLIRLAEIFPSACFLKLILGNPIFTIEQFFINIIRIARLELSMGSAHFKVIFPIFAPI